MAINIPGLVSVIVFYLIILVIGIVAGRKKSKSKSIAEIFLADRSIGVIVSIFTITASWICGGFINGTAEIIAQQGLAWTQAPFGYSMGLILCGIFFGPKLRRKNYVTMFDPFQEKYGERVGALMCIPQFFADLFWSAAILSALGATMHVILDLDETMSIIISAVIAVSYTFFGGLWSVAYTDVVQLVCIAIGLYVACPFAITHPAVNFETIQERWAGSVSQSHIGVYIDTFLLLVLGGTTWQEYYQRVLACRSAEQVRFATLVSAFMTLILSIPPAVIGIAGAAADWNVTSYTGELPIPPEKMGLILPLSLQYLCPTPVSVLGLGAVAAAVMSSTDSAALVTATVFTKNIYKSIIRQKASERELIWTMRVAIVVAGVLSATLAVVGKSVYGLFVLSSDLMYVILFPQFVCVLYVKSINAYGSLFGFFFGFLFRVAAGEPLIDLPALIRFPMYNDKEGQLFPFRSVICFVTFFVLYVVSFGVRFIFEKGYIDKKYDVLQCCCEEPVTEVVEEECKEMIEVEENGHVHAS